MPIAELIKEKYSENNHCFGSQLIGQRDDFQSFIGINLNALYNTIWDMRYEYNCNVIPFNNEQFYHSKSNSI